MKKKKVLLLFVFLVSGWLFFPQASFSEGNGFHLKVAALKLYSRSVTSSLMIAKIEETLDQHPDIDLLVTPEYTFYRSPYYQNPVIIDCSSEVCLIQDIGTSTSKDLKETIETIQYLASQYEVNVVLGTVSEFISAEPDLGITHSISFNSQLIINKDGEIIGVHRKVNEWYPHSPNRECAPSYQMDDCSYAVKEKALEKVQKFNLVSRENRQFSILPTICSERDDLDLLDKISGVKADLLVHSEREGDVFYEEITHSIQEGTFEPDQYGWDWAIEDLYIKEYLSLRQIIKEHGFMLVSEGGFAQGGIFDFRARPLEYLEITDDYVYGEIRLQEPPLGDVNGDFFIDLEDFSLLFKNWGLSFYPFADFDDNALINSLDFAILYREVR